MFSADYDSFTDLLSSLKQNIKLQFVFAHKYRCDSKLIVAWIELAVCRWATAGLNDEGTRVKLTHTVLGSNDIIFTLLR